MRRFSRAGPLLPLVLLLGAGVLATPTEAPPLVVAFALDTSGSVGAQGATLAQALASGVLSRLPAGSQVTVFSFDDQARLVLPRTSDPASLGRALASLRTRGRHTALNDALFDASRSLRDAPAGCRFIVLVTDGKDEDSSLELVDGLRLAVQEGIPVFALGVGKVEERVLRRIAKLSGGEYLPARQASAAGLAARMMERASQQDAAASTAAAPRLGVPATTGAATSSSPAANTAEASVSRQRNLGWLLLILGLVASGAAAVGYARRRGRSPRCPTCRRPLADTLSPCAFCAADVLSPTVLARLSVTEEYLDKTVTLRERPVLVVNRGPAAGRVYELNLDSATCIGRARVNDIVLDDVAVSGEHCRIRAETGGFVVHDLKSTNGTLVNDHKVDRRTLSAGGLLQVGETFLQFRLEHRRG